MLCKEEVLKGRDFEIFMSGYAEGIKDTTSQLTGGITMYEEATEDEVTNPIFQKGYNAATKFMYEKVMSRLYGEEEPKEETDLSLDNFMVEDEKVEENKEDPLVKYQREVWDSLGEPMTQEELDELHCIGSEEDTLLSEGLEYAHGYSAGYDFGFERGYTEAENDVRAYNVVLSGEFLAEVKELSNKILSYHKKGEKDHNFMLYDINHALMQVVESWAMEQIYNFWSSTGEDDEEEDY